MTHEQRVNPGRFDTGPHPYLDVFTQATATIDLVRAARTVAPELSRTWGVVGASQGGHAALGSAHLQATYAPEPDFRGTVAIDPASDVEKLLPLANPLIPAAPNTDGTVGFFVSMLAGVRETRPDANVDAYLTPLGRTVLDEAGDMCLDRSASGAWPSAIWWRARCSRSRSAAPTPTT